jgi:hypothetical protein
MPLRSFHHEGREWTVWDTHPGGDAPIRATLSVAEGYGNGWLTFQSDEEKRRLVPVPPSWVELTEAQLVDLLDRASPVRRAPGMRF